jgi:hypothetical protein
MAGINNPIEKLILNYPRLLKVEGLADVVKKMIGSFQYPLNYSGQKWHQLGMGKNRNGEARAVFMSLLIELIKWHAGKKKKTPTIKYMNKIFRRGRCPELGYFISRLQLFDSSYNQLLVLAGCSLNRKYFKAS